MGKKRKIGIHYRYNENWIGGTYYIENLIAALNTLPESLKPELIFFTDTDEQFEILKSKIRYPFFHKRDYFRKLTLFERIANKIYRSLGRQNVFLFLHSDINLVFPAYNERYFPPQQKFLYWIPDFQEHYLPQFFTKEEIELRKSTQREIVQKATYIVFSSESARRDFNDIYPENRLRQFVLPFAVGHPTIPSCELIAGRYRVKDNFFICSNQFWKHKNQNIILEALHILRNRNTSARVVFTGKEHDYRNPGYFEELRSLADKYSLNDHVQFLGFIPREDQLCLMRKSIAVLQPSLFEGWSTTVEDAKSMNQYVIASDLSVHREQLTENVTFFNPYNAEQLANVMQAILENKPCKSRSDYQLNIKQFAENFINIVEIIDKGGGKS